MSNNNSIWFVEGPSGRQYYSQDKPERALNGWRESLGCAELIYLNPPLSIQAITGRTLTWEDEPLEWKTGEESTLITDLVVLLTDVKQVCGLP
jgi:hypothetical protein